MDYLNAIISTDAIILGFSIAFFNQLMSLPSSNKEQPESWTSADLSLLIPLLGGELSLCISLFVGLYPSDSKYLSLVYWTMFIGVVLIFGGKLASVIKDYKSSS